MERICKNCGFNNESSNKFCVNCGAKLPKEETMNSHIFCYLCGSKNDIENSFCIGCGAKINFTKDDLDTAKLTLQLKKENKDILNELKEKKEDLENIEKTLNDLEKKKLDEIELKLAKKKSELDDIDKTLQELENKKLEEIDGQLAKKKSELDDIDKTLQELENKKLEEIDGQLAKKKSELDDIDSTFKKLSIEKNKKIDDEISVKNREKNSLNKEIKKLKKELVLVKDELDMQCYGLYEPRYDFVNSIKYKEKLDEVRRKQKYMIKNKTAAISTTTWTVNNSLRKGAAMTNANLKQILRSFNNETEVVINKVKHSNIENSKKRIEKSFNQLNKLYARECVELTYEYYQLKLDEMYIAYEYQVKKQEEKELLREARAREREEKKIKKQLEKEKDKFNKENEKINKEIERAKLELLKSANEEKSKLEKEIEKLRRVIEKNNLEIKKIDEWKERPGAGYVYIISNIGSFGKDIFKIGVTRRDKPEERIRELSSASVPFKYDTHAFIFSKDAFSLESELHKRFENKRVNKINRRKEFFNITIDDVKKIVEENKGAVHSFSEQYEAEEYYDTLKIEKKIV